MTYSSENDAQKTAKEESLEKKAKILDMAKILEDLIEKGGGNAHTNE